MNRSRLDALLAGDRFVSRLYLLDTTSSTNDELRRLAAAGAAEGTVVIAEEQHEGRGRLGRRWHSAAGLGLYLSVLLRPERPPREVTRWTLAASLAACEACRQAAGCAVEIEWPNDLLFLGRKLGGILAEARSAGGSSQELIIGLGLNVHHGEDQFPPELRAGAISLRMAGAPGIMEREALAAAYLSRLGDLSGRLARGEWNEIAERWQSLAPGSRGRAVRVVADGFEGLTCGIDGDGALQVRNGKGVMTVVRMAEAVVPVGR